MSEIKNSPIKWLGGKSLLANKIIDLIPKHETYIEPFFGAGHVFFKKPKSKIEVINDIHSELMNFFNICKNRQQELIDSFKYVLTSRDYYNKLREQKPLKLNEIERAHRFYYMIRAGFGGKFESVFGTGTKRLNGFQWNMVEPHINNTHKRLVDTVIENIDYKKIFEIYDYENSFFFVDPPYLDTTQVGYGGTFEIRDFKYLNKILRSVKGKFLMTHNDNKTIRDIFEGFNIENIGKRRSCITSSSEYIASEEIFITNYKLKEKHTDVNQFTLEKYIKD